jgi:DNA polymerase III delta' subunit
MKGDVTEKITGDILSQVLGHDLVRTSLLRAASSEKLSQAMIFSGPSGVGKKFFALGLAQWLLCSSRGSGDLRACGVCPSCLRVASRQSESVYIIEPDGAQIKIEQAREIKSWLSLRGVSSHRVVIVEQAHLLNPAASNSLLKVLEEPPANTHFILITASASALPSTIRSRAQMIWFASLEREHLETIFSRRGVSPDELQSLLARSLARRSIGAADFDSVEGVITLLAPTADSTQVEAALEKWYMVSVSGRAGGVPSAELGATSISSASAALRDLLKDKQSQLWCVQWLLSLVSEKLRSGQAEKSENIPNDVKLWQTFAERVSQLEADFARHYDRALMFEELGLLIAHS